MEEKEEKTEASQIIEYTPEELAQISELTAFFNRAPGQVDLPVGEVPEEEVASEEEFAIEEAGPTVPKVDLGKFALDEEIPDLGDLGAESTVTELSAVEREEAPLDLGEIPTTSAETPLQEFPSPVDLEPSLTGPEEPSFGEISFEAPSADFGLEVSEPQKDLGIPDLSFEAGQAASSDFTEPIPEYPEPPSLAELQPEVVLGQTTPGLGDLSGELSSLAREAQEFVSFSPTELKELRRILKTYPSGVRSTFVEAVLEDKIKPEDLREVVNLILDEKPAEEIAAFLEQKTGLTVETAEKAKKIRQVASRPAYTVAGMQRQAQILRLTRNLTIFGVLAILLTTTGWFAIIKPYLYRRLVQKGRQVILYEKEDAENLKKAENYFTEALSYYPHDYYAYLQYADAYKKRGRYSEAFEKLFGKLEWPSSEKRQLLGQQEINSVEEIWPILEKVPYVEYADGKKEMLLLNNIKLNLKSHGAFLISQLIKKKEDAQVLLALGQFHANPARRFRQSPYRNNLLAIDYFRRILTFKADTPFLEKDKYLTYAISGIGNVYYYQKDYYRSLEYFEKIIRQDPYSVAGQTGVMQCLLKIYQKTQDPRLIIQQHSIIKNELKIEEKLPMFLMARLAAFYIDLPEADDMRIRYNVSPTDAVTGEALKDRAETLLTQLFTVREKDIYGNIRKGDSFAEGYYQRGRFYRYSRKQLRMAMKQMEYAYRYNPRHFLALNDHAEMLMELKDYVGALELLKLAYEKISPQELELIGDEPEDETLLEADLGLIPFNMGKAMYLSLVKNLGKTERFQRIAETDRYQTEAEYGQVAFLAQLDRIDSYFQEALEKGISAKEKKAELLYYMGWSLYARGNYRRALAYWEQIPTDMQKKFPSIDLAKSHGLYRAAILDEQSRQEYLNMAMGHLLFLREKYQKMAEEIRKPNRANSYHNRLFTWLSIIENNLGAIYELKNQEKEAMLHYYSSINYSKKIEEENETAQLNVRLAFKRKGLEEKELYPVIMDFIPPFVEEEPILR